MRTFTWQSILLTGSTSVFTSRTKLTSIRFYRSAFMCTTDLHEVSSTSCCMAEDSGDPALCILDDILVTGKSSQEVSQAVILTVHILMRADFIINVKKVRFDFFARHSLCGRLVCDLKGACLPSGGSPWCPDLMCPSLHEGGYVKAGQSILDYDSSQSTQSDKTDSPTVDSVGSRLGGACQE